MAVIAPFKGLLYNPKNWGNLSRLVAPPYDVISEDEQQGYYRQDPHNVIRLILGKSKIGDSDWDNRYTRSADFLRRWESEDVLVHSDRPSMYLYSLTYDPGDGGGSRTRWGLIALVRIEDEGSGAIIPHERTFTAHKIDRLNLIKTCSAQLSQIFCLFSDPGKRVFGHFRRVINDEPMISFGLEDGTTHRVWIIQDQRIFKGVADLMLDKSILIADGHHRYETSRNFRNFMRARYGRRRPNRSYEYTMMYLTNMDDPGLTILPSHRLIRRKEDFRIAPFLENLRQWFDIDAVTISGNNDSPGCPDLKEILVEKGKRNTVIGFHPGGGDGCYILSLKPGARNALGDDLHPSLQKLDVLVLSRLIFQKSLGFSRSDLDDEDIFHYHSDMEDTISLVESGEYQMAFLLNPTRIGQVREVTNNALIMPRKSTYFYPKVLSGLVFNKIDPNETIPIP